MARKTKEPSDGRGGTDSTEIELAACTVVFELLRSGRILTYIGDILVERVDEAEISGESEESVVIRRFCDLVVPDLVEDEQVAALWKTAELIETVREKIVADFRLEIEGEEQPN